MQYVGPGKRVIYSIVTLSFCLFVLPRECSFQSSAMVEPAEIAVATVYSILIIVNIVGNSLVCAIIKRNREMRYADTGLTNNIPKLFTVSQIF